MSSYKLLIHSAKQLVQVTANGERVLRGESMRNVVVLDERGSNGLSVVINSEGLIEAVDYDDVIRETYTEHQFKRIIDASGKVILPGLVDGHTHPVWAGDRVHEFAMKLEGATYMEIHKAGGGIGYTVDCTRKAKEEDLLCHFSSRLRGMLRAGTTLVECKSGYGLDTENEVKMLRVINKAKHDVPIDISTTYCGAHSVPKGYTAGEATEMILNEQIPHLRTLMDNKELDIDNIDVFCEKGVYDVEQTRRILQAGMNIGLAVNFHGEELNYLGSAEMGAEIEARAISHLEEVSDEGIQAMSSAGCIGVILPTTAYILRLKSPPVRKMIDSGMAVALGSDFNPNAFCMSMPLVMHLACVNLRMTMSEALAATTINAAASLGHSDTQGSIELGKKGDLIVVNAPKWEHLIYQLGNHHTLIQYVIKDGDIVVKDE